MTHAPPGADAQGERADTESGARATRGRPVFTSFEATSSRTSLGGTPRLPRVYIPRRRLWERLGEATNGAVTLLVAPAGAGKSLGAGGWLRFSSEPQTHDAIWLAADESLTSARLELEISKQRSLGSTAAAGSPRLVIVDDAHLLPSMTVRMLDRRLNTTPDTMRVLLLSRWDLPLTRLVPELLGDFTTLRGDLLRLDDTECATLVQEHARTGDPRVIRIISERAQGWCAAVVLAARSISGAPDPYAAAQRLADESVPLADQIASEVFSALTQRQRHLLLCVASQGVVDVGMAAHLSHDLGARDVLTELDATGLVTRMPSAHGEDAHEARFRVHPLLTEVIRRRLLAGGVDVQRAQATVVRAVRLDLARRRPDDAFARLVSMRAYDEAAEVLAVRGVQMLFANRAAASVADFARSHPDVVESRPEVWLTLAIERWWADDAPGTRHWTERIVERAAAVREAKGGEPIDEVHVALARLMLANLGLEPTEDAVDHAKPTVARSQRTQLAADADGAPLAMLHLTLGSTLNWLGDLAGAGANLTTALSLARSYDLHALEASALSHLALTELMAGRENACIGLALDALAMADAPTRARRPQFAPSRAALALLLGTLVDLPWPGEPIVAPGDATGAHMSRVDLCTQFWLRMRDARLALMRGGAAEAQQILMSPREIPELSDDNLPVRLRTTLLVERGLLAALSSDRQSLKGYAEQLAALGVHGEAALIDGLRADLDGERRGALRCFESAAAEAVCTQPPTRALALVCQAQLLDALGQREQALERIVGAVAETETRRNAVPFLGWIRQGTPIRLLLAIVTEGDHSTWARELAAAAGPLPDITARFRSTTPPLEEHPVAADVAVVPALSPREREVLGELARGATYADIAARLFVSENTVKTHVSSLYGKLGVSRRRDALAVGRSLHLV